MSRLLEIFGRAITSDITELLCDFENTGPCDCGAEHSRLGEFREIICLLKDMKPQAAAEKIHRYLLENPSCLYGRLTAAAIFTVANRLHEAVEQLQIIYKRRCGNLTVLYSLGHCCERLGRQSEAAGYYQDCLKFKDYLLMPRQRLAAINLRNCQIEKAAEQYERLRDEYPGDLTVLLTLGHLHIANRDAAAAAKAFDASILMHPDSCLVGDDEITRLIHDGEITRAIETIDQFLKTWPESPDLLVKLGDALAANGMIEESAARYCEALEICPDLLDAAVKLSRQYELLGRPEEAAARYNSAAKINDRIVESYMGLAAAAKLQKADGEAIRALSLAASIAPNTAVFCARTASLRLAARVGQTSGLDNTAMCDNFLAAVLESYSQRTALNASNPQFYYQYGLLLMALDKTRQAAGAFEEALSINPAFATARDKLLACLYRLCRHKEAVERLDTCERIDQKSLDLYYNTAILYCDRIGFASRLLELDHSIEESLAVSETAFNISVVLQNLGLLDPQSSIWSGLSDTTDSIVLGSKR
jgi:tetratricopeptide (TPR) repeat protein